MSYRIQEALAFALHQADMQIKTEFTRRLKPYELTSEQFAVLATLWRKDGMSQRELGDLLVKDRPNVTRMLDKMTGKGLLERRAAPDDRRVQQVFVTAKGRALEDELVPIALAFRAEAYRGISAAEQTMIYSLLNRILRNLNADPVS
ncbi:MAG: MarR family winged helix-turn-helix transcriptional regulator [Gammaproteobacteria bacterium]